MTIANLTTIAYFAKAKEVTVRGNNGKDYDRVLLFLTYSRTAPQFIVETSTKKYKDLVDGGLQPGSFVFAAGELTFLPVNGHEYEEYVSEAQKKVCYHLPVLKNTMVVAQPTGSTPVSSVTYVGQLMFNPQDNDRNGKPFYKITDSGLSILNISPVVRGGFKDAPSSWMQTVIFSKKAEFVVNYFKKMDLIAVDGYLDLESYEKKAINQDTLEEYTVTQYKWMIKANNVRFCGTKSKSEGKEPDMVPSVTKTEESSDSNSWDSVPF